MNRYVKELNRGKEIVIVPHELLFDSAIFWKKDGLIFCFAKELGVCPRDDMSDKDFEKHINMLLEENAQVFIRGNAS